MVIEVSRMVSSGGREMLTRKRHVEAFWGDENNLDLERGINCTSMCILKN